MGESTEQQQQRAPTNGGVAGQRARGEAEVSPAAEADTWAAEDAGADEQVRLSSAGGGSGAAEPGRAYDSLFDRLATPQELGRYVVLDSLGHGGVGVVLRAYDRQLDRAVALKVLHRALDEQHVERLRREAQAMAKLSHPNVVQVYEVGEVQGQMFVAMELIKGKTVRAWMNQRPRPGWRACVELFMQLGAGLAAAHDKDLIHRDFKPGNAMLDDTGRAWVLDFGLVRLRKGEADDESAGLKQARVDAGMMMRSGIPLTQTGAVLGTPAYMSPEQIGEGPVDSRCDQFSFCVALYEAVYGERPYPGDTLMELWESIRKGKVRPAPRGSEAPLALRKVLLQGIARDPEERWVSMEAVLEQLRRVAAPRRRRGMMLLVGIGLLSVGGGLGATRALEWLSRCEGAHAELRGVWDDAREQEVKDAILGTGLSYARGTWERVEPGLDAYAAAWVTEHTEACEATHSRREQSEREMSLRMGCLHQRRQLLRATVDELREGGATVVEHAARVVANLPGLERCRDLETLRAEVPPPEDPAVARQVVALGERLLEVEAKQIAGKYEDGLRLADEVVEHGDVLGYEPLMVRAWWRQGLLRIEMGHYEGAAEVLRLAYGVAVAHTMKEEAAEISAELIRVLGHFLARHEEARGWGEHARPLSLAAGTDAAHASYLESMGILADSQGKYEDAQDLYERALAIKEQTWGPKHFRVAESLRNLGEVVRSRGDYDRAQDLYERALAIEEKVFGSDHPGITDTLNSLGTLAHARSEYDDARDFLERALAIDEQALGPEHADIAALLSNLGALAYTQGDYESAREFSQRALGIEEKVLGPEHPNVAMMLNNLGTLAHAQGDYSSAGDFFERALGIEEKVLGPEHPDVAVVLNNLGALAYVRSDYEDAREFHGRALRIEEKALGPEHPAVARALNNLGSVAYGQGEYDEAREFHGRALALWEKALGPEHPDVARALTSLGNALIALGKPTDALPVLERALTIHTKHEVDPADLAVTRFVLARALWMAPVDRDRNRRRARILAEQARKAYAALDGVYQGKRAEVQAWLAEHHVP